MGHRFLEIVAGDAARAAQARHGSRAAYARMEGGKPTHASLGEREEAFIADRDSFYLASVTADGWPYLQHRGGPAGFLRVLSDRRLGFADLSGNKQYLTLGNIAANDRVALFLMDYPNKRRLKLLGRMRAVDLAAEPAMADALVDPSYPASPERGFVIALEAYDWNCPQHIVPRYTADELAATLAPLRQRLARLEAENAALRAAAAHPQQENTP